MLPTLEPQHAEPLRVLVVEPDGDTRSLYRQMLELAGYDIIEATDGRDALVKALENLPQFVVMETRLPMMDGYALCEILRQDRLTHAVPILVVTSEARSEKIARARAVGANAVLVKPVQINIILDEMKRLIEAGADDGVGRVPLPVVMSAEHSDDGAKDIGGRTPKKLSQNHLPLDKTATPPPLPPLPSPGCDTDHSGPYKPHRR